MAPPHDTAPLRVPWHVLDASPGTSHDSSAGGPLPDLSVCSAGAWRMSAKVAQRMSVGPARHALGGAGSPRPSRGPTDGLGAAL